MAKIICDFHNVHLDTKKTVHSWGTHRQIKSTLIRQLMRSCVIKVDFICKRRLRSSHGINELTSFCIEVLAPLVSRSSKPVAISNRYSIENWKRLKVLKEPDQKCIFANHLGVGRGGGFQLFTTFTINILMETVFQFSYSWKLYIWCGLFAVTLDSRV